MADFATTLHYPLRDEWVSRGMCLTADDPSAAVCVARILAAARSGMPLVLNAFGYPDRIAAGLLSRKRRGPKIILTDCTWHRGTSGFDRFWTAAGVAALRGPNVVFCVLSTDEMTIFPRTWGIDQNRLRLVHWYHGLTEDQMAQPAGHSGPVFAGGWSMRDYRALLTCSPTLPAEVLIVAPRSDLPAGVRVPDNVRVEVLPGDEFSAAMRDSSVVVVPLKPELERSAGITVYLDAMAMGKLVIVTDTVGVRDYIEDHKTGLIVAPNDPQALGNAIRWALDTANAGAVEAIRENARDRVRTVFSPARHVTALLEIIDQELGAPLPRQAEPTAEIAPSPEG